VTGKLPKQSVMTITGNLFSGERGMDAEVVPGTFKVKEYLVEFDETLSCVRNGKPNVEEVKWKKREVECYFLPRKKSECKIFLPVREAKRIVFARKNEEGKLVADTEAPFDYEPKDLTKVVFAFTRVCFHLKVDDEAAKKWLKAGKESTILGIQVLLDPFAIQSFLGELVGPYILGMKIPPAQPSATGTQPSQGIQSGLQNPAGSLKKAAGKVAVKLEKPLPFIYSEAFPNWVPGTLVELTVDTTASPEIGTDLKAVLYNWMANEKKYKEAGEWLEITFQNFTPKIEAPEVRQVVLPTFRLFTKRAIIGDKIIAPPPAALTNVGTLVINRTKGEVPPRNQPLTAKVGYKPAPNAKLSMKVYLGDKEIKSYDSLSVNGEQVELIFPNLPAPADDLPKATIKWMVTNETARVTEDNTPFKTTEQVDNLVAVSNPASPGTQCAGKTIDIVDNPITMAKPVTLDVTAGPSVRVELNITSSVAMTPGSPTGACIADADGKCVVTITVARVTKDGVTQTGKFRLRFESDRKSPIEKYEDDYFTQIDGAPNPDSDSIRLQCRFHLSSDDAMAKLPASGSSGDRQVTLPNASSPGASPRLVVYFEDPQLSQLFPDGVKPATPPRVTLRPIRIKVETKPDKLPGPLTDHANPLFQSLLTATVISPTGRPVPQKEITSQDVEIYLRNNSWRLNLDLSHPSYPAIEITAHSIDSFGKVLFKEISHYKVDENGNISKEDESLSHAQSFYLFDFGQWCWDPSRYVFKIGPDMEAGWNDTSNRTWKTNLKVAFMVNTNTEYSTKLEIGRQVRSVSQSWDYSFFFKSGGEEENPSKGGPGLDLSGLLKYLRDKDGNPAKYTTYKTFKREWSLKADGSLDVEKEMKIGPSDYFYKVIDPTTGRETTVSLQDEFNICPDETILVGGGGHHCLKRGNRVWHYLKANDSIKNAKWINRDQMQMRADHPRTRHPHLDNVARAILNYMKEQLRRKNLLSRTRNQPVRERPAEDSWYTEQLNTLIFKDSWVYCDTLEDWIKNHSWGFAYMDIVVYKP
jgi:hypothetical protein